MTKDHTFKVRMPYAQYLTLKEKSEHVGMNMSDYVRRCIDGNRTNASYVQGNVVERDNLVREISASGQTLNALLKQIVPLASNINQLTKFINADGRIKANYEDDLYQLKKINELIDETQGSIQTLIFKVKEIKQ